MSSKGLELTKQQLLDIENYENYPEESLFEQAKNLKLLTEFKKKYLQYQKNKFISNNIMTINKVKLNGGEYKISNVDGVECITNFAGQVVTRTLIYPSLICIDLVTEQEEIELTYKKRGEWCSKKFPRSFFSSGSKIEKLASFGISVDMNSKTLLSKYLNDMLDLNIYKIPVKQSIDRLGWYENTFIPYDNEIEVTGEENFDRIYKSIHEEGDFKVWLDEMTEIRKSVPLRLVMAASLGSVMNEKLGKNGFVTHVWGGTGCGKTVALQVAASIWANPNNGQYITKMNNTANFISRLAAFLYNMPAILDELETFNGDSKELNELIMNLTEGIDRGKAKKEGGVQDLKVWHNSYLFSGEHSISNDNLGGGTYNRLIEIYCRDKIIQDGVRTSAIVKENYGFAGQIFVEYIKNISKENLLKQYNKIYQDLLNNKNTEEKQAQNMAILLLADKIAVNTIFLGENELTVKDVSQFMFSKEEIDVSERAWIFIQNELAVNISKFMIGEKQNLGYECWGKIVNKKQEGWSFVDINKNSLKNLLEKNGFSYNKTINDWDKKKYILRDEKTNRRDVNTSLNGKKQWVFRLNLKLLDGGD